MKNLFNYSKKITYINCTFEKPNKDIPFFRIFISVLVFIFLCFHPELFNQSLKILLSFATRNIDYVIMDK